MLPSQKTIAQDLEVDVSTVKRWVKDCKGRGVLRVISHRSSNGKRFRHVRTTYTLCIESLAHLAYTYEKASRVPNI